MTDRMTPEREAEIAERTPKRASALTAWLDKFSPFEDQRVLENAETVLGEDVPALLAELAAVRAERDQARVDAFREAADAVLQSSHGELMRDAYNAKMQAVGILRQLATGKTADHATPAETATEYGIRIPGGRVLKDGNTKDRAEQVERLDRYRSKALWPDAVLVQRPVSYGEWAEATR